MTLTQIPTREILHFLGWHGTPVEPGLMETIKWFQEKVLRKIEPRVVVREFELLPDGTLAHTHFLPLGKDVPAMLSDCRSAVLLAATLGADLILLSDVSGILDGKGQRIAEMTAAKAEQLIEQGIITDGMIVKVNAALDAARTLGRPVDIASWRHAEQLPALFNGMPMGTRILA